MHNCMITEELNNDLVKYKRMPFIASILHFPDEQNNVWYDKMTSYYMQIKSSRSVTMLNHLDYRYLTIRVNSPWGEVEEIFIWGKRQKKNWRISLLNDYYY